MSMFPHTVTLYNVRTETDKDTFKDTKVNHITILRGVLLDASKAINVRTSGLEGADAVNLYIPFDVEAIDGRTREAKRYIDPIEFWKMDDVTGYWTLQPTQAVFFAKGEVVSDMTFQFINMNYDDVYAVTKVDKKDFGNLQHFEVGGN